MQDRIMTNPASTAPPTSAGARLPGTPKPGSLWTGADGITLAADTFGDPAQPLAILMHGGGQTRHSWRRTAVDLSQAGLHVVAFDARGHGDSDWSPSGDYAQDALVQDLLTVAAHVGDRPAVLVGASMGGMTALVACAEYTFPGAAIALVDVAPLTEESGYRRIRGFMKEADAGFATIDDAAASVARYRGGDGKSAGLARSLRRMADGRLRWHWDPRLLESRHAEIATSGARLSECVRRTELPMLLLRGAHSDFVSAASARHFLSLSPHAAQVEIPGAGHMITGDRNDVFGASLRDFVVRNART